MWHWFLSEAMKPAHQGDVWFLQAWIILILLWRRK